MAFQQNAFQHDAFQIGASAASSAPQRLPFWRPLALVALGFFAAEETQSSVSPTLHVYRSASSGGMEAVPTNQLVLIEEDRDAVRTNHAQRLFFGRTTPAGVQAGQPWYLQKPQQRIAEEEEYREKPDTDLHRYRVGYQTVGQPAWSFSWKAKQVELPEAYDVKAAPPTLHQYRVGYQTVGQSYRLWPTPKRQDEVEDYSLQKPVDLTQYRNSAPFVPVVGAPWYLWKTPTLQIDPEEEASRVSHTQLHRFRVGYQTVGQPFLTWPAAQKRVEAEEFEARKPVDLNAFRSPPPAVASPGAPWHLWKPQVQHQQAEEYLVLNLGTYASPEGIAQQPPANPGAPWYLWKPQVRHIAEEEYVVPKPSNFALTRNPTYVGVPTYFYVEPQPYPVEEDGARRQKHENRLLFGKTAPAATPGAPWYLWNLKSLRVDPEDDATREDHAKRLFFGRTTPAVVGAPWHLWDLKPARIEPEDDFPRTDHAKQLLFGKTIPAVVGAPWHLWNRNPLRIEPEEDSPRTDHNQRLFYGKSAVLAPPNTPLWFWPPAIAWQDVEPNPVVTDHAAALYPFRPHDAIVPTPPQERVEIGGGVRKKQKSAKEELGEIIDGQIQALVKAPPPVVKDLPKPLRPVAKVVQLPKYVPPIDVIPLDVPPKVEEDDDQIVAVMIALGLI